ncbi:hypothetical protein IAQ61_004235 [Plenodomus lingam]|uniref:uncharacterized protein n=1 Tax=Leptosphaeria maculans TaxID=5022 RepID=UPI00331A62DA|nr:hypothetical protein IAQ61_004235 [Plenodomus lingam]
MPILDGLAATRSIREQEMMGQGLLGRATALGAQAGARLPIIAVTANVRKEQIDQAIAAGAVCWPIGDFMSDKDYKLTFE